jgi:TRAP-type mannitol/chloroaromatic compound transport system substrate-binding protein
VSVKLLPGGEIFPALQRGVIDAAEFVGPFQDRKLGLMNAAKYYYATGWHEPSNVSELLMNKKMWDGLPPDLQAVIQNAAAATNQAGFVWSNANNAEALEDLVKNYDVKVAPLPDDIVETLRKLTFETLDELTAQDPLAKKVNDDYFAFKKKSDAWLNISEAVVLNKNL